MIERGMSSAFATSTVTIRTDRVAQFLLRTVPKTIDISAISGLSPRSFPAGIRFTASVS